MAKPKPFFEHSEFPDMIEVDLDDLLYPHLYARFREDLAKLGQGSDYSRSSMAEMNEFDILGAS